MSSINVKKVSSAFLKGDLKYMPTSFEKSKSSKNQQFKKFNWIYS